MRDKIVLTDVDGTIVDFAHPFHDWMDERGFQVVDNKHLTRNFLIREVFNCSPEEHEDEVLAFSESPVFAKLPALPNAQEAIQGLRDDGWRVVAITACHVSDAAMAGRKANMKDLFGIEEQDVIFVGPMASKLEVLSKMPKGYWVEDLVHHAQEGYTTGHIPIIFDRPYNRLNNIVTPEEQNAIVRLDNWVEIEAFIRGHYRTINSHLI